LFDGKTFDPAKPEEAREELLPSIPQGLSSPPRPPHSINHPLPIES
jgi:hypothetical protein